MIDFPYEANGQLQYTVYTTATSGSISTKYFGYKFNPEKVTNSFINIDMKVPEIARDNENFTVYYNIEWNPLKETLKGLENFQFDGYRLGFDEKFYSTNITKPRKLRNYYALLNRKVAMEDVSKMKLDRMPGFKLNWFYVPQVPAKSEYQEFMVASQEFIK